MPALRILLFLTTLLLLAGTSRAQSRSAPASSPATAPTTTAPANPLPATGRQMQVNVEVPKAVSFLSDCAKIVFSREDDGNTVGRLLQRFRARKEREVVTLQVDVPRNKVTKTLGIVE